ncbi:hypothetical protein CXF92_12630 [Pseudomonas sp. Choline-3u-10]|uniref:hypothetical protein n=1 Tax=Pseudomonas sp. Choline-3u-10 TaxID=2058311 RepID=UPI000C32288B|nr:hypothetical protein [Pseudomonas sp. Choline-3u-10]PKG93621.1 hypothetical protein CXF92_12630 [Pseudomonas sp. Choline-3u-10]
MQAIKQLREREISACSRAAEAQGAAALKSAIRLGDFWAAFGAQGMVALAWTLGGMNAARIRNELGRFPLLRISGEAASGKSLLLGYLSKLSGKDQFECRLAERITTAALSRTLATANGPIVFELENAGPDVPWDQLKPLFSSSAVALQRAAGSVIESFTFSGSVILVERLGTKVPVAIRARSVEATLQRPKLTPARRAAVDALNTMPTTMTTLFQAVATERRERIVQLVNERAMDYAHELETDGWTMGGNAMNYGQLLALLDALNELLGLSDSQLEAVRREIRFMSMDVPY